MYVLFTPKTQVGKCDRSYDEKTLYEKCNERHDGKFLVGTGNFYSCGKSCHMKRDFPMMKSQGREYCQA